MLLVCGHCARLCDEAWWRRLLQSRWPGVCEAMGGCGEGGAEGGREGSGSGGIARVLLPRWEGRPVPSWAPLPAAGGRRLFHLLARADLSRGSLPYPLLLVQPPAPAAAAAEEEEAAEAEAEAEAEAREDLATAALFACARLWRQGPAFLPAAVDRWRRASARAANLPVVPVGARRHLPPRLDLGASAGAERRPRATLAIGRGVIECRSQSQRAQRYIRI